MASPARGAAGRAVCGVCSTAMRMMLLRLRSLRSGLAASDSVTGVVDSCAWGGRTACQIRFNPAPKGKNLSFQSRVAGVEEPIVLIPGAGGAAWLWHRVVPLLEAAGHEAIALDLPADDPAAGLDAYADLLVNAAAGRDGVIVVAQSMGAFTALHASARLPLRKLVLLNAMIPAPGETAGDWWEHTGSEAARLAAAREHGYAEAIDLDTYFFHDV